MTYAVSSRPWPKLVGSLCLFVGAGVALAADPLPPDHPAMPPAMASHPAPTKEMREKMAVAHEQMAVCLRSDRPIEECHDDMKKLHDSMGHDRRMGRDHAGPEPIESHDATTLKDAAVPK